jgi:hypothetical protein
MNWRNTAENLIITIITFIVGVILGSFITYKVSIKIIDANQKVLIEAIKKESTSINNDYDIKNKKGTLDLQDENKIEKDSIYHHKWWRKNKK